MEGSRSHVIPVMIRGLGHRRSGMLKSYSVEHILLTFFKYKYFLIKWIDVVKSDLPQNYTPSPHQFVSYPKINIMHEHTETDRKYTCKIGIYSM